MMVRALSLISILLILSSCDQSVQEQKQKLHSDHTVFGVHKLAPHADFFAYESEQLAVQDKPARPSINQHGSSVINVRG